MSSFMFPKKISTNIWPKFEIASDLIVFEFWTGLWTHSLHEKWTNMSTCFSHEDGNVHPFSSIVSMQKWGIEYEKFFQPSNPFPKNGYQHEAMCIYLSNILSNDMCVNMCIYIHFLYIYIRNVYVMSPIFRTLFPFFQIAASKKKDRLGRDLALLRLVLGAEGIRSTNRPKGIFFGSKKTSFGTAETVVGLFFSHKTAFEKNMWGKKWVHLPHKF